jgi:uncharacterized membrane protein
MNRHIKIKFEKKQLTDASLSLILLCLLFFLLSGTKPVIYIAVLVAILSMLHTSIIYPWAVVWYTGTELLGNLVSKILLAVIYFFVVLPVGFVRRLSGKDSMQLRDFGKSSKSVFRVREKQFVDKDLETPY